MNTILGQISFKTAKGEDQTLAAQYAGNVLLVVNVASECGFTQQYEGLQKLYEKFAGQGFQILGFPCNQFGGQEPGTDDEIQNFCSGRFGVRFPVLAKVDVNGAQAHPLFTELKKQAPGILGTEGIKWNFTKFLIGKDGAVLKRYAPQDKPEGLVADIEAALK
jgi:glutathione peroxidase